MSTLESVRDAATPTFEITRFTKADGGLMTKVISLNGDGTLNSDGSHCKLWQGKAERVAVANAADMAALIGGLRSDQAITLGRLRPDLSAVVPVMTKAGLSVTPGAIARTGDFICFASGVPAFALIDIDTKGIPSEMLTRIVAMGGFGPALASVMPDLAGCAYVERSSTSSWLWRNDSNPGCWVKQASGVHFYVPVADGADIPRLPIAAGSPASAG